MFAAALALWINQIGFVYALKTTSASVIALILAATPIFAALIGLAFGTEVLPRRFWLGAALSFRRSGARRTRRRRRARRRHRRDPVRHRDGGDLGGVLGPDHAADAAVLTVRISAVVLPLSWIGIALVGLPQTRSQDWQLGWEVWVLLLFATLGPLVITNILWFRSLDRIGASRATLATNLQPFVAALFAVVLLGERIDAVQIAGGLLIGAGILAARRRSPVSPGE